MDIHQFTQLLKSHERKLKHYVSRGLPVKAGAKTKSFVQENFRKGGFQDQSLEKWPLTRRQFLGGRSADAKRGPLLSSRKVLYSSTGYKPGEGYVTLYNNTIWSGFSGTHEQQGKTTITIRLAFDCYDATYNGAEQDEYTMMRHKLRKAVHQAIQGLRARESMSSYTRQHSCSYTLPHRIKVYEQDYTFSTMETNNWKAADISA